MDSVMATDHFGTVMPGDLHGTDRFGISDLAGAGATTAGDTLTIAGEDITLRFTTIMTTEIITVVMDTRTAMHIIEEDEVEIHMLAEVRVQEEE